MSMDWKTQHSKGVTLPQIDHWVNEIPIKIQAKFFCRHRQGFLKVVWKDTVSSVAKTILK